MKKLLFVFTLSLLFVGLAWGQTTIFEECVPTFTDLPIGWTSNNGGGQAVMQTATGGYLLVDHLDDWVVSSAYDLSLFENVALTVTVATYGSGVNNPITIEVSNDNGSTWTYQSFVSDTPTSTTYISSGPFGVTSSDTQVKFRFRRDSDAGKGVRFRNIKLEGDALVPIPVITVTPDVLSGFAYEEGSGPSEEQSFTVSGENLTDDVTISAPTNYQISETSGSGFTNEIIISGNEGTLTDTNIYVRLAAGLSAGFYDNEILSITSVSAVSQSVTLNGAVSAVLPDDGYLVNFDGVGETKTSYASGTVNLTGLNWDMTEALIGTSDSDWKNGERSARMRGYGTSAMTMLQDKTGGLGTLSFQYRRYGTEDQVAWKVEYSTDGGASWVQIGSTFTATADVQTFSEDVNVGGNVRIKISSASGTGTNNRRLNIDDILLTDHESEEDQVSAPTFAPGTGFYTEEQNVAINCETDAATIYYSMDSNAGPWTVYNTPINVSEDTTIWAYAAKDGWLDSSIIAAMYSFPIEVEDIAALRAGATDGTVYSLTGEAILTFQQDSRNQKYIQDDTAAILIDDDSGTITTTYNIYDGITGIMGTLGTYANMLQFIPIADPGAATSSGNEVIPEVRTLDSLDSDDQAKLIKVMDVTLGSTGTFDNSAQSIDVTQGETTGTLRTFADTDYNGEPIPEGAQNIIAIVVQYYGTMQISPRFLADFAPAYDYPQDDPIIVGDDTITFTQGSANEGPVVEDLPAWNNNGLDPASVTTLSFTLLGDGPWTITITTDAAYGAVYYDGAWHAFENVGGVVTIEIPALSGKGGDVIVVLGEEDPTLPVTLSSFTAVLTADLHVSVAWVAESETDHAGYNILRSEVKELATAIMINPALIEEGSVSGSQISYDYTDAEVYPQATYYYWLESRSLMGESEYYGPLMVTINAEGDEPEIPVIPTQTQLFSAFPNPFNPSTNLRYSMKDAGDVRIDVYNVKGQLMQSFERSHSQAGYYQVSWDGRDLNGRVAGTGVYFYRMTSGRYSDTRKMVLAK